MKAEGIIYAALNWGNDCKRKGKGRGCGLEQGFDEWVVHFPAHWPLTGSGRKFAQSAKFNNNVRNGLGLGEKLLHD